MKSRDIAGLQEILGHSFTRPEVLEQALTHTSQAREREALQALEAAAVGDNEQLAADVPEARVVKAFSSLPHRIIELDRATLAPYRIPLFRRFQTDRDIVLVDQRGTGDSNPLTCKFDEEKPDQDPDAGIEKLTLVEEPAGCEAASVAFS